MKNKQKSRRRFAWCGSVLLCIFAILPVFVIPAGAASTSDIVPTTGYIMIQFDPDSIGMNDAICSDSDWDCTAGDSAKFYYAKSIDGVYTCVAFTGTLTVFLDTANHASYIKQDDSYLVTFYDGDGEIFDGDDTGPSCDYVQLFITQEIFNQIGFYLLALGGQVSYRQDVAFEAGYAEGYDEMFNEADEIYSELLINAKAEGESIGYEKGYSEGESIGYTKGEKAGYDAGFSKGQTDALNSTSTLKDLVFSIFSAPADLINGILDFNLFGINLSSFVKTLITLAITALVVVFLLKLMRR